MDENTGTNESSYGWIFWLLIIGGFIFFSVSEVSENKSAPAASTQKNEKSETAPSYPEVAMPNSGAVQLYSDAERIAPFTVQTDQGANYLVKLVSTESKQPVLTMFLKGGSEVSTEVPLGTYEVRYASGEKWYGYTHLFGPDTTYSKAESTFTFENNGYQVSGYTITLYNVVNGNLRTSTINPSQF